MSYRKVSEGGTTFEHSGAMGAREDAEPVPHIEEEYIEYALPMSYIHCPTCGSKELMTCNCLPVNYFCVKCEWTYTTHSHKDNQNGGNFSHGDISQNSLISGTVRK